LRYAIFFIFGKNAIFIRKTQIREIRDNLIFIVRIYITKRFVLKTEYAVGMISIYIHLAKSVFGECSARECKRVNAPNGQARSDAGTMPR